MMPRKRLVPGLWMAFLAGCGAGCGGSGGTFETVAIDPSGKFPVEAGGIEITAVHVGQQGELKTAQALIRNPGGHAAVWVTANWYNAEGAHVPDPKETQREVILAPGETTSLSFVAPRPDARFPWLQVRRGSKRPH